MTDAHNFSMHPVFALESDTTVLRKPDTSANSMEWMYPQSGNEYVIYSEPFRAK